MPATFDDIQAFIDGAIEDFNKGIPGIQQDMLDNILQQLRRLDTTAKGDIKVTVANIKIINAIRQKLNRLIINDAYIDHVKAFVNTYSQVATLQNEYWKTVEKTFQPKPLLREIRQQAIATTVDSLTENGIGANIRDNITGILKSNITTGGSYKQLEGQLRESLTDTQSGDGLLTKYARQVTVDSIQQFNRTYTQTVASGLNYEWYRYAGTDIKTTRPFCFAMTDPAQRYFHISEVPALLRADDLFWTNPKTGERAKVPLYDKTGLPQGMYPGENHDNFFILLGGYNCGHQARPVSEERVPLDIRERVAATAPYKAWRKINV
jgi:hypothetical protein